MPSKLPDWREIVSNPMWETLPVESKRKVFSRYLKELRNNETWRSLNGDQKFKVIKEMQKLGGLWDVGEQPSWTEVPIETAKELGAGTIAAGELLANQLGEFAFFPAQALPGLVGMVMTPIYGADKAAETIEKINEKMYPLMVYQPRTKKGKEAVDTIHKVFDFFIGAPSRAIGEAVQDLALKTDSNTFSAVAATVANTIAELAGFLAPIKAGHMAFRKGRVAPHERPVVEYAEGLEKRTPQFPEKVIERDVIEFADKAKEIMEDLETLHREIKALPPGEPQNIHADNFTIVRKRKHILKKKPKTRYFEKTESGELKEYFPEGEPGRVMIDITPEKAEVKVEKPKIKSVDERLKVNTAVLASRARAAGKTSKEDIVNYIIEKLDVKGDKHKKIIKDLVENEPHELVGGNTAKVSAVVWYHGSPTPVKEFKIGLGDQGRPDTYLGPHFAIEPSISNLFATDKYRSKGIQRVESGEVSVPVGSNVIQVRLEPNKVKRISPDRMESDTMNVVADALDVVFKDNKKLFVEYLKEVEGIDKKTAGEIYDEIKSGNLDKALELEGIDAFLEAIPDEKPNFGDLMLGYEHEAYWDTANSLTPLQRKILKEYRRKLREEGYDALVYENTFEGYMDLAENVESIIVINPDIIKYNAIRPIKEIAKEIVSDINKILSTKIGLQVKDINELKEVEAAKARLKENVAILADKARALGKRTIDEIVKFITEKLGLTNKDHIDMVRSMIPPAISETPLDKAIIERMPNRMSGGAFEGFVKSIKGVKKDELAFRGLIDLFKKDFVTKEEVIDHLNKNIINIEEVKYDHAGFEGIVDEPSNNYREILFMMRIGGKQLKNRTGIEYVEPHFHAEDVVMHTRLNDINTDIGKGLFIEEVQSEWFKELRQFGDIAKMDPEQIPAEIKRVNDKLIEELNKFGIGEEGIDYIRRFDMLGDIILMSQGYKIDPAFEIYRRVINKEFSPKEKADIIELADTMKNSDLSLKEIGPLVSRVTKSLYDRLDEKFIEENLPNGFYRNILEDVVVELANTFENKESYFDATAKLIDRASMSDIDRLRGLVKRLENLEDPDKIPPLAPFKNTWYEILLNRLVQYAAENNYDFISWTWAKEQNERYNLRPDTKWTKDLYEKVVPRTLEKIIGEKHKKRKIEIIRPDRIVERERLIIELTPEAKNKILSAPIELPVLIGRSKLSKSGKFYKGYTEEHADIMLSPRVDAEALSNFKENIKRELEIVDEGSESATIMKNALKEIDELIERVNNGEDFNDIIGNPFVLDGKYDNFKKIFNAPVETEEFINIWYDTTLNYRDINTSVSIGELVKAIKDDFKILAKSIFRDERGAIGDLPPDPERIRAQARLRRNIRLLVEKAKQEGLTKAEEIADYIIKQGIDEKWRPFILEVINETPYARSVNLNYQDLPDEVKEIEREAAKVRGKTVQTWDETGALSEEIRRDYIKSAKLLKKAKASGGLTAAEIDAIRQINVNAVKRLHEIAQLSPERFAEEFKKYEEEVFTAMANASSEVGRALNIHKKHVAVNRLAETIAKLERGLNERELEEFRQLNLDNPIEVLQFIKRVGDPRLRDYFYEFWYNSLLSGISTHLVNTITNTIWALYQIPHRALKGALDRFISRLRGRKREIFVREIVPMMAGYMTGFIKGKERAIYMIKTGKSRHFETKWHLDIGTATMSAFERSPYKPLRALAPYISFPTRVLRAMDIWANSIAMDGQLRALARREGLKKGLSGKELEEFERKLLENPTEKMLEEAAEFARHSTFMDDPDQFTRWVIRGREMIPGARIVVPFVNTVSNLLKRGLEFTPGIGAAYMRYGGKGWAEIVAKQIEGSILTLYILYKIDRGEITGPAPEDKAEREAFYRMGKLPWSIKIGDTWYSYRRLEPFSTPIAMVSILYEQLKHAEDDDTAAEIFMKTVEGVVEYILDSSFMQGVSNIFDRYGRRKAFVRRFIASLVPYSSFWRSINRAYEAAVEGEAKLRDTSTLRGALSQTLPFGTTLAEPRLNVWGEEIVLPGGPLRQWLPYKWSAETDDPLENELWRLEIYPGMPSPNITIRGEKVRLPEKVYREYVQSFGKRLHSYLSEAIKKRPYLQKSDSEKKEYIEKVIRKIREAELKRVKKRYEASMGAN